MSSAPAVAHAFARTGGSTAMPGNVAYRLAKLDALPTRGGRWLDCGCADGGYTAGLAAGGNQAVVGIDSDLGELSAARANSRRETYAGAFSEALPFRDETFDGVLLNEVLEHVADEQATLAELHRVLRPGGTLAVFSPNRWFPFEGHGMTLLGRPILFPIPFLPWLPKALAMSVMRARNYWPGELQAQVASAGFKIDRVAAAWPVFELYRWLPAYVVSLYRHVLPSIERTPFVSRFGVSSFILGHKGP